MALTPAQREARVASLQLARAARAANRQSKDDTVPAPENLVTTTSTEAGATAAAQTAAMPPVAPDVVARAMEQRQTREDVETAAMMNAQDKAARERGFDPKAPTPMQKGAVAVAQQDEATRKRARAAALAGASTEPLALCRITKTGHGKVSMGIHVGGVGEAFYEYKEEAEFPISIARALENRGLVEINE